MNEPNIFDPVSNQIQSWIDRVYRCKSCSYCYEGADKKDRGKYFCTLKQGMNVLNIVECQKERETANESNKS